MKGIKHRDPKLTKNGRLRVRALNLSQLEEALNKTSQKKIKHKIQNRIAILTARSA